MDAKKKNNLEETYERILNVGFCIVPYEDLSDITGPDPMVYGTAKDERILSFEGVEALFKSQYEQVGNMKPAIDRKRIALRISNGGNNAYIIEELTFTLSSEEEIHTIFMRATCVMEYLDNQWKLTHWHTSTPVDTENDPWHMEEWKREKEKLQQLVDQQTAALKQNNRELQIEAALEKIRSSSLAMQKTENLREVVKVLFEQMQGLSVDMGFASVSIFIFQEGFRDLTQWLHLPEGATSLFVPYFEHPISADLFEAREMGLDYFSRVYSVEEKNAWLEKGFELTDYKNFAPDLKVTLLEAPGYAMAIALEKRSGICVPSFEGKLPKPEDIAIMKRVAKVFEQAYTRFLDLQKAEAQAREAQIEAALERVRSRSMAMQKSDELAALSLELVKQVQTLGVKTWFCAFNIYLEDGSGSLEWGSNGEGTFPRYITPREGVFLKYYEAGQRGETLLINEIGENECPAHYEYLCSLPGVGDQLLKMKEAGIPFPSSQIDNIAFFKYGYLLFITYESAPESYDIFKRFAKVFEQTYTRFLDLQKAEAQTREAQIELSLERVRARVTAMQSSEELFDIVVAMRKEFVSLGHDADYFWHMKWSPEQYEMSMTSEDGNRVGMVITVPKFVHEGIPQLSAWEKGNEPYFVLDLNGPEAWDYLDNMNTYGHYDQVDPHAPSEEDILNLGGLTFILARTTHGEIGFSLSGKVPDPPQESIATLIRFAGVFDIAYKRFEDLKKAEKRAREAQIELSLERIRGQVASMQESTDLLEIMVDMRKEFVSLGYEAHYFWYMRWLPEKYEKTMTSGDGTQIGMVMSLPRHIHGNIPLVADWEKGEDATLVFPMEVDTAVDYVDKMITLGDFEQVDPQAPTLDDIRHIGGLTFIMARTSQGEIGYSIPGFVPEPPQEAVHTLARFARVFDLAYKRFEDLKKAERDLIEIKAAKQKAETSLSELKATQAQLIQQEKLASLGQLTAGIAHEIKNPLNFVNNFSEVSRELIEEIKEERAKSEEARDESLVDEILQDLESNLDKIHEHGSRANGIVSSMLQHSRGGSGKKEPTDLNSLIKECVNLSFHGMRAGKNPINVNVQLDLDESIDKVDLVGEDFSRVILNLCNNAFDAMRATAAISPPKLSVRTKLHSDNIFVEVEDNGSGIPNEIRDKILQPFFTTKKGTEGTGLGLSITHDIVKAHGGVIDVDSDEGAGTIVILRLPKDKSILT
jgi:signal transduction histidine kinase